MLNTMKLHSDIAAENVLRLPVQGEPCGSYGGIRC